MLPEGFPFHQFIMKLFTEHDSGYLTFGQGIVLNHIDWTKQSRGKNIINIPLKIALHHHNRNNSAIPV